MKFPKKRRAEQAEVPTDAADTPTVPAGAQTAKWTSGSAMGSKGVSVVVAACLVCGPLAFVGNMLQPARAQVTQQAAKSSTVSVTQQSAGSYALGYVAAWLGATQKDSSALDQYIDTSAQTLSKNATTYRNMAVASIDAHDPDVLQVVIAADVKPGSADEDDTSAWPRRYFQASISVDGKHLTPIALPAPVAGPTRSAEAPSTAYGSPITPSSAAGETVVSFLDAYLTGQGKTDPFTAPSTSLPAISPAPYSSLTPVSITATDRPAEHPSDGDKLFVLATVTVADETGHSLPVSYAMTLRARADRWEVAAIATAPLLTENTASTPTPTATPTTKGN
ncbi:conjugal transfer protein [Curtobacterium flaccumfaciens pv. oortii]|uniref:conjugal transfer protein n=1 Tax=Curtobacterium flaccumfaciens TaxID=2035 RepID=UPI002659F355|nr:conjugal transfer protein [Curtobacterium flaccumfaciens]MCS5524786.1 conjugal transfer protein [Curtobacterium flaccumfaciens pv. oortii]